eukprot:Pgem_evm1s16337
MKRESQQQITARLEKEQREFNQLSPEERRLKTEFEQHEWDKAKVEREKADSDLEMAMELERVKRINKAELRRMNLREKQRKKHIASLNRLQPLNDENFMKFDDARKTFNASCQDKVYPFDQMDTQGMIKNMSSTRFLLAIPSGLKNKPYLDLLLDKFSEKIFDIVLFVYDQSKRDDWIGKRYTNVKFVFIGRKAKWSIAFEHLPPSLVNRYAYILFWDDDITPTPNFDSTILMYFLWKNNIEISQPFLASNSHYRYLANQSNYDAFLRAVPMVEIMVPIYSSRVWRDCIYRLTEISSSGYGIDNFAGQCGLCYKMQSYAVNMPVHHNDGKSLSGNSKFLNEALGELRKVFKLKQVEQWQCNEHNINKQVGSGSNLPGAPVLNIFQNTFRIEQPHFCFEQ